jgi:para-aminobenzoate synthetase / 4-amino-4-deoxychorismate lyase
VSPRESTSSAAGPDPGQGVFDTLLVQDHRPIEAVAHVRRLAESAAELYHVRLDRADLVDRVNSLARSGAALQRLRLTLPAAEPVELTTTPLTHRPREPWTLWIRSVEGGLGSHKWVDRAALDPPPDEPGGTAVDPLLVDASGLVLETGRGNLFVVADGVVSTPPLDGRILPGVVRGLVLDALEELDIAHTERIVTVDELMRADEVFATNSIGGVRGVAAIHDVAGWARGAVTERVDAAIEQAWGHVDA